MDAKRSDEEEQRIQKKIAKYRSWIKDSPHEANLAGLIDAAEREYRDSVQAKNRNYLQTFKALKKLCKMVRYLQQNPNEDALKKPFQDILGAYNRKEYEMIHHQYDQYFSAQDFIKAKAYFMENPNMPYCGSAEGMMFSYINQSGKPMRPQKSLGKGAYGGVKSAEYLESPKGPSAIKRQNYPYAADSDEAKQNKARGILYWFKRDLESDPESESLKTAIGAIQKHLGHSDFDYILQEFDWLPTMQAEAAINIELGLSDSPLVIRRDDKGKIYKVYQEMKNLGMPVVSYFKAHQISADQKLQYAIDLLLLVDSYHSGTASKTAEGMIYIHGDIKEANILIDQQGKLRLIDHGFTKKAEMQAHLYMSIN